MYFYTFQQCPPVGVKSREGRQQRRMDIHQPAFIALDKILFQKVHETGKYHQIRVVSAHRFRQRGVERLSVRIGPLIHHSGFKPASFCDVQGRYIRAIADDCSCSDRKPGVDQRLQIAAATGNQDNKGIHHFLDTGLAAVLTRQWFSAMSPRCA
jgi:hypothetical protein